MGSSRRPSRRSGSSRRIARTVARPRSSRDTTSGARGAGGPSIRDASPSGTRAWGSCAWADVARSAAAASQKAANDILTARLCTINPGWRNGFGSAAEREPRVAHELEELWHWIGSTLRVQKGRGGLPHGREVRVLRRRLRFPRGGPAAKLRACCAPQDPPRDPRDRHTPSASSTRQNHEAPCHRSSR